MVQCDCCDYFCIPDGSDWEICPVCFWEQDAFGISAPDDESNANHGLSLREGRQNFLLHGACLPKYTTRVVSKTDRAQFKYAKRLI